jgi:2-methylisocitrate lyase-like PEP mutase family enzyme
MSKDRTRRLAGHADALRALHRPGHPIVLPNAWDAASAKRFAKLGYPAIATTSAGVANALGWADGEAIPPDEMFAAVGRIAAAVDVPVTADLEAGYQLPPEELVARVLASGCVGLNLEDSSHASGKPVLVAAEENAKRLAAVKQAGRAAGVDLVLNARVDVFVREPAAGAVLSKVEEGIRRGRLYLEAGADCVYPITAHDERDVASLVEGIRGPVNILALPMAPPLALLAELGVARVTFGSLLFRQALGEAERFLGEYAST